MISTAAGRAESVEDFRRNLATVNQRIADAARRAGRADSCACCR